MKTHVHPDQSALDLRPTCKHDFRSNYMATGTAVRLLKVSKMTVHRYIIEGKIFAWKIHPGSQRRICSACVHRLLQGFDGTYDQDPTSSAELATSRPSQR